MTSADVEPLREPRWAFLRRPGPFTTALAIAIAWLLLVGVATAAYRVGEDRAAGDLPPEFVNVGEVFDWVRDDAVDAPDPDELVQGAIDGMLATLDDPYARFYGPEAFTVLSSELDGEFTGIGVQVEERPEGLFVVNVFEDSPAAEAGVQAGERIVSVDGEDVTDLPTRAIIDRIGGEEGTQVTVGFDSGPAGPRELTMTRARLTIPEVTAPVLDSGLGHLAVRSFSRNADTQLREELEAMLDEGVPGVILDLRGNPGGLLEEAVEVTSLFLEEGVVVRVESRDGTTEHEVSGGAVAPDLPLVVLVDRGSASASEIVAGALQDHDRADIVGETTFGKGTVQTIRQLEFDAGVKFTTARYFTPSGDSIEGVGVTPDLTAYGEPEAQLAAAEDRLRDLVAAGTATERGGS